MPPHPTAFCISYIFFPVLNLWCRICACEQEEEAHTFDASAWETEGGMPEVQGQPGHRLLGSLLVLESTQHLQVRDGGEQYKYDEVCLSPTSDRESVDTEVGMCKALRKGIKQGSQSVDAMFSNNFTQRKMWRRVPVTLPRQRLTVHYPGRNWYKWLKHWSILRQCKALCEFSLLLQAPCSSC